MKNSNVDKESFGIIFRDSERNRFLIHSLVENAMLPADVVHLLPTDMLYKSERGKNFYLIALIWSLINRLRLYDEIRGLIDSIFFSKHVPLVSKVLRSICKYTPIDCKNINDQKIVEYVRDSAVHYWLVLDGSIVRQDLFETGKQFLNSHKGYLPDVRGLSSTKWAILTKKPFGASVHLMDSGVDTGPILYREQFPITNNSPNTSLYAEWQMQKHTLLKSLALLSTENYNFQIQEGGMYFSSLHPILAELALHLQSENR